MASNRNASTVTAIIVGVAVYAAVLNYDKLIPLRWQTYTAPDAKYSVEMPGKPEVITKPTSLPDGGTLMVYAVRAAARDTEFNCSYAEHPNIGAKEPSQALEDTKNGTLTGLKATLLNQHSLTVQNYPALEYQARTPENLIMDSRLVVVGNRIYIMIAVTEKESKRDPKMVSRVFDSLRILKSE